MVTGACAFGVGCGSNNNGGTGGAGGHADAGGTGGTGTGGHAADAGAGGTGTGGAAADAHPDTTADTASTDVRVDTGPGDVRVDAVDAPADVPTDTGPTDAAAPTFTQVYNMILSSQVDNAPGCAACHDGIIADGGPQTLPHVLNFRNQAAAYAQLVGVPSLDCPAGDGGTGTQRVLAGNAAQSLLFEKLNLGLGLGTACGGLGMPRQRFTANDGGSGDGGPDGSAVDAGFTQTTHYAINATLLGLVMGWINAGALNN
jgi:hypothetical protein